MARIVYFGMSGQFSRLPLEALLAAGHDVRLLVLPALAPADSTRPAYTRLAPRASVVGRRVLPLAGAHAPPAATPAGCPPPPAPPAQAGPPPPPPGPPPPPARAPRRPPLACLPPP